MEDEKRRHAETQKIVMKKERRIKEMQLSFEEDRKQLVVLQDQVEKMNERNRVLKRALDESVRVV